MFVAMDGGSGTLGYLALILETAFSREASQVRSRLSECGGAVGMQPEDIHEGGDIGDFATWLSHYSFVIDIIRFNHSFHQAESPEWTYGPYRENGP